MDLLSEFQSMSSQFEAWATLIVLIFGGFVVGYMLGELTTGSYKQGQIDALNGKIKYEKRENEDGELVWEEKPKFISADEGPK